MVGSPQVLWSKCSLIWSLARGWPAASTPDQREDEPLLPLGPADLPAVVQVEEGALSPPVPATGTEYSSA